MDRSERAFPAAYARAVRGVATARGVDARAARRVLNRALVHASAAPRDVPSALFEADAPPADARVLAEHALDAFPLTLSERARPPRVGPDALARAHETALTRAARASAGAYYTDAGVSALMTRLAVFHHVAGALAWAPATARGRALARLVLDAPTGRALAALRRALTPALARDVLARVDALTLADPACGAGAFLVTALDVLTGLHERLHALAGTPPPPADALRARVVARNLHARDVDAGAVELARVRLWAMTGGAVVPRNVRVGDALTSARPEPGFDVIVGNPPYFRMEDAAPVGHASPRAYHAAVVDAVYAAWPERAVAPAFRDRSPGALAREWPRVAARASRTGEWPLVLDRRSDVSAHFVLKALASLRPGGTLAFVTTNSWLDTAYGAPLRGHLAGHTELHALVESATARSFGDAAVNTVILLASRPRDALPADALATRVTRFASFRDGFPSGVDAATWTRVLGTRGTRSDARVRVRAVDQRALYAGGARLAPSEDPRARPPAGDAWGRRYLRAPPVFEQLLDAGRDVLVPLGDVARVTFGVKTGCNAFFHATRGPPLVNGFGDVVDVEERFLEPVLKSPRDVTGWRVDPDALTTRLVRFPKDPDALTPAARAYVARGERLRVPVKKGGRKGAAVTGVHRLTSLQGRSPWFALGNVPRTRVAFQQAYGSRLRVLHATAPVAVDARLYACMTGEDDALLAAVLNSSFTLLQIELAGRVNFGDGALDLKVRDAERLLVPRFDVVRAHRARIVRAFERLTERAPLPFWEDVQQEDRQALDRAVLGACGLEDALPALHAEAGAPTRDRVTRARALTG